MLAKILGLAPLEAKEGISIKIQQKISQSDVIIKALEIVMKEAQFYGLLFNKILAFLTHITVNVPNHWEKNYFDN